MSEYLKDTIIDRIKQLQVDCPECESVIESDDQYCCLTCEGSRTINVYEWMNKPHATEGDEQ